tara:strand:+ start:411 stop:1037 length:627 start_codon:yes stop_codon:yes gene_type:complete
MLLKKFKVYKNYLKTVFDFTFALIILIIVSPILLITCFILVLYNQGSPFFTQKRPGKNNRVFRLIKFKTMNDKRDEFGKLLPDNERITSIGSFVRKTSIDELPQLINVLLGDMSLVGPRPLLVEYLPLYNKSQMKRHDVRPGITGWAQVNGRNSISWKEKFVLDVWYVENQSFLLDIKILFLTINKVFRKEGISEKNNVTMSKFTGNK